MANLLFVALLAALSISSACAYSAGAPVAVCDDMTPKHDLDPQKSELPYKVSVDRNAVKAGEEITIKIAGKPFKGFLLQVRNGDKAVGAFLVKASDKDVKTISCHGGVNTAATHTSSAVKNNLVLKWKAPEASGNYILYATIAESGKTFWVRKATATIKVQ